MPELRFKTPCNDCPFRRDATPGWLGASKPEWFTDNALADYAEFDAPCHKTIDYSDPDWRETQYPGSALCAGALIFAKNNGKSPRDPRRSGYVHAVELDPGVFRFPHEFKEHHEQEGFPRSWEFK